MHFFGQLGEEVVNVSFTDIPEGVHFSLAHHEQGSPFQTSTITSPIRPPAEHYGNPYPTLFEDASLQTGKGTLNLNWGLEGDLVYFILCF